MEENIKIKINYDDLKDPKIDEVLKLQSSIKIRTEVTDDTKKAVQKYYIRRQWIYFLIAALAGSLIIGSLVAFFVSFSAPKDRYIVIGNSRYLLSKEAQKYFKIQDVSDYEKTKSVIIIEEPHYSIEGQYSLYKGLEVFFHDNPDLLTKTIFLSEGLPSNLPISVKPLVDVNNNPDEELIREVLGSFLIPGYIAYEWKYPEGIPIVGIEDDDIYKLSSKLWVQSQDNKDNNQALNLWNLTVIARNKRIANTLIEKTKVYENPILFVGGLHLAKPSDAVFQQFKKSIQDSSFTIEESGYLNNCENFGIYDYLKQEKIGYTFLTSVASSFESANDIGKNIDTYTRLFKAQQRGDCSDYIDYLISERNSNGGVTVSPSTEAAAQFAEASSENKGDKKKDDKKNDGKKNGGKKGNNGKNGKKGNGNNDGNSKNPRETVRKGDKLEEGNEISEKEAAERVKNGEDVMANNKEEAERIARDAGNGKDPIHEDPHKPGYRPHYHTNDHGKGHVFY